MANEADTNDHEDDTNIKCYDTKANYIGECSCDARAFCNNMDLFSCCMKFIVDVKNNEYHAPRIMEFKGGCMWFMCDPGISIGIIAMMFMLCHDTTDNTKKIILMLYDTDIYDTHVVFIAMIQRLMAK